MHVKREKDRYADQQRDQKYPPMNLLEFDDWLLHFIYTPSITSLTPRRGAGLPGCFA
jgi:hypothetical protein